MATDRGSGERNALRVVKEPPNGLLSGLNVKLEELEDAVSRQTERFQAVLEIGNAVSSARDVDELLRTVMDKLTGLLHADASTLFMFDRERSELWSRILKGSSLKEIRVSAEKGIVGAVMRSGRTLVLDDAYADPRFNPDVDRLSGFKTRSIIAAPLRHVSGRILGVAEVLTRRVNAFSSEDVLLVETVASQISAVLDNVLLLEQLRTQNEQLRTAREELASRVEELDLLYDVEQSISAATDQTGLLDTLLLKATSIVGAKAGSILLLEQEKSALFFKSVRGEKSDELVSMTLKPGQGIAGRVAQTGAAMRVDDAEKSEFYDRSVAKKLGVTVKAVLAVPIPGETENLGALELLNKPGGFTAADERLATLLAGQTGRAILLRAARQEGERKGRLEAIGQMLSSVLHDLRTPMTVVAGYAQIMATEDKPQARAELVEIIEKQIEHVNAMTRETLAFARGEKELLVRKVYLQNFCKELEDHLRKDFERSKVELKLQANYTGPARFDENKMKRVVYNIARNAAQAMPGGGKFTFQLDREGEELLFRFADNGPGIPPEIADKLFQSFVTAGKKDGTGLGLAIVKQIAEEHGGTVTCKSKQGKGTTFELRIPAGSPAS